MIEVQAFVQYHEMVNNPVEEVIQINITDGPRTVEAENLKMDNHLPRSGKVKKMNFIHENVQPLLNQFLLNVIFII